MDSATSNRRLISIVMFVAAILFVVLGIVTNLGITGILLGIMSAIVGVIFRRRGK